MRISEKCHNSNNMDKHNNNFENRLTSRRTNEGKKNQLSFDWVQTKNNGQGWLTLSVTNSFVMHANSYQLISVKLTFTEFSKRLFYGHQPTLQILRRKWRNLCPPPKCFLMFSLLQTWHFKKYTLFSLHWNPKIILVLVFVPQIDNARAWQ